MTERTNRRETIIDVAAELFQKQGYTATSVRQIAEAVGVTEAALYYHFKDGKRALLGAVLEDHMPDLEEALQGSEKATTLRELLVHFGHKLGSRANREQMGRFRWLAAEYPNMSDDERTLAHERMLFAQRKICESLQRFIPDETITNRVAWVMMVTAFGYGQMFINLGLESVVDFSPETLVALMADLLSTKYG
jgi:AcrR family transcriptional regulator